MIRGIFPTGPVPETLPAVPARIFQPAVLAGHPEEQQTATIYQSVIRRLYRTHHASGEDLLQPRLFLLYCNADAEFGPYPRGVDHKFLSEPVREWILHLLNDLPVWVIWLEQPSGDLDRERLKNLGTAIAFHGIRYDDPGMAFVEGIIHQRDLSVCRFVYVVEKRGGIWEVKSTYQQRVD
jgi:hypothetical protein